MKMIGLANRALGVSCVVAGTALCMNAFAKSLSFNEFVKVVDAHGVVPHNFTSVAGICAVIAELLTAVLLVVTSALTPRWRVRSLLMLTALLCGLTFYVRLVALNPPSQPTSCGCFSHAAPVHDWNSVLTRNAILLGLSVLAAVAAIYVSRATGQRPTNELAR